MSLDPEPMDTALDQSGASPVADVSNDVPMDEPASLELAPTPMKKPFRTYKGSAKKRPVIKQHLPVSAQDDSDDEDQPSRDSDDAADETTTEPVKPLRVSGRRQADKPASKPKAKPARQSTRKTKVEGKGKTSSPVGSEGSDLTDIEDDAEENVGKADKGASVLQCKQFPSCPTFQADHRHPDTARTGRGRNVKATKYAESDSESSTEPEPRADKSSKRSKTGKPAAQSGKQAAVKKAANGTEKEKEVSDGSLSSLEGSEPEDEDATEGNKEVASRGRASGQKSKRVEGPAAKGSSSNKLKGVDDEDDHPDAQDNEPNKSKRRKAVSKSDDAKPPAKQRIKPAANGTGKKEKKTASTSAATTNSPKKTTANTRKGKASLKPQSSTQLSGDFLAMVFGSSQPMPSTTSRIMTDSESSDGDERQKVSKLFAVTNLTPQKRKGKGRDGEDGGRGGKRQKGKDRSENGLGMDTDGSATSTDDEPAEIHLRRDLT